MKYAIKRGPTTGFWWAWSVDGQDVKVFARWSAALEWALRQAGASTR